MTLNPLDWTGGQFLTLYIFLAGAAWAAALIARRGIGDRPYDGRSLDALALACLAGGPQRVGDAMLAGLLAKGAAKVGVKGAVIEFEEGGMTRDEFQRRITPDVDRLRSKLEGLGLIPNAEQAARHRTLILTLFAGPVILGMAKAAVGLSRDKPIAFLVILLIITLIAASKLIKTPLRTAAGNEALARHKIIHAREARAPLENEFALAVALAGLVVLSGTPHEALYAASQRTGWSAGVDGGPSDGGDGGASGCGGCGGG